MTAIAWAGEPGDSRCVGRAELGSAADRLSSTLQQAFAVVLPPLPELVAALMACDRLDIPRRLVHPLASPDEMRARITAAGSRIVLTSSALVHRGELVFLKERVDDALQGLDQVTRVVVHDRTGWMPLGATMDAYHEVPMLPGRDVWYSDLVGDMADTDERMLHRVEAPSLRTIVEDPSSLKPPAPGETLFLYEGYLEPEDAARARTAYVGASGTSLGSLPEGRLS